MRIVGGQHKGFRFTPPRKTPARPTTDIAKEGLFNILENRYYFEERNVLDIFGGTGSISFEFASRGIPDITLVELDRGNIRFIKQVVEKLEFPITVLQEDVFKYMERCTQQYNFIFAGPPYPLKTLDTIPDLVFKNELLKENGILILEHNPNHKFDSHPKFSEKRNYGTTIFSFFIQEEKNEEVGIDSEE